MAVVDGRLIDGACTNCGWEGWAVEINDPALDFCGWSCPDCETVTDTSEAFA